MTRLILFDIDGTLLRSDGAGRRAMEGALAAVFGTSGPPEYRYDGKTDPQIVRDLMRHAGHADGDIDRRLAEVVDRYLAGLERELATGEREVHVCAGVPELLDALEARHDVVLGLLTGNVAPGAALKLRAAGIDPGRFRVGAFGSDSPERPRLPAVAQRRARELLGLEVAADRMLVIGDTPHDIHCGRELGARAIAVATGRYSVDELAAHEPLAVFADLSDTARVLDTILAA